MFKKALILVLCLCVLMVGAVPASAAKTSITWLHHFNEDGMINWVQKLADEFMTMYPDCEVLIEQVGADSYSQILKTKIASDDAPMVFDLIGGRTSLMEFYDAGHLYDLSDMACIDNIKESMLIEGQYDGTQSAIPIDMLGYGVFYNEDIFDELGLEVPTTLTDFFAVCEALTEAGYLAITSPYGAQWCIACALYPIWYQSIDIEANPDWWTKKMSLEGTFADDADFQAAMDTFLRLCDYTEDDPFGTNVTDSYFKIANKEAGMFINGSWVIDGATSLNPDANIGCFAMPIDDSGEPQLMLAAGSLLCLYNSEDADKMEYGKLFYDYIYSYDSGMYYAQIAKRITCVEGVDLSEFEALSYIMNYEDTFSTAGKNTFSTEYSSLFIESISNLLLDYLGDGSADVMAMCVALDEGFADITGK